MPMNLGFDPNSVDRVQLARIMHGEQVSTDYANFQRCDDFKMKKQHKVKALGETEMSTVGPNDSSGQGQLPKMWLGVNVTQTSEIGKDVAGNKSTKYSAQNQTQFGEVFSKVSHLPSTFKYTITNANRMKPREVPDIKIKLPKQPANRWITQRSYSERSNKCEDGAIALSKSTTAIADEVQTENGLTVTRTGPHRADSHLHTSTPVKNARVRRASKSSFHRSFVNNSPAVSDRKINSQTQTNQPGSPWLEDFQTPVYPSPQMGVSVDQSKASHLNAHQTTVSSPLIPISKQRAMKSVSGKQRNMVFQCQVELDTPSAELVPVQKASVQAHIKHCKRACCQENPDNRVYRDTLEQIQSKIRRVFLHNLEKIKSAYELTLNRCAAEGSEELESLKETLNLRREESVDKVKTLQNTLASCLLNYRKAQRQCLELKAQSQSLIAVNTNMLKELQTEMLELQNVFCLWLSQNQLHCPSCFREVKQTEKQVANSVNSMLVEQKKTIEDYQESIQTISRKESRLQRRAPAEAAKNEFQKMLDSSVVRRYQRQASYPQDTLKDNVTTSQCAARLIIFPCGDSICDQCQPLDGGVCPVCYAPVSKVVQAKIPDESEEMFKNMKFSVRLLNNLGKTMSELVLASEMGP